jgi:hypothetical protein
MCHCYCLPDRLCLCEIDDPPRIKEDLRNWKTLCINGWELCCILYLLCYILLMVNTVIFGFLLFSCAI